MSDYATVNDISTLWRALTTEESEKAEAWLPLASSLLRKEAAKVGKDLDALVASDGDLANVAKSVTVAAVVRVLSKSTDNDLGAMSQMSQSALGYSVSGTFSNPGDELYFLNNELKRLGLKSQQIGVIDIDIDTGDYSHTCE